MSAVKHNWLREAAGDENGMADAAYVSILGVTAAFIATIGFICVMSAVSYARCKQIDVRPDGKIVEAPCVFEPQPLALGIAAAIGAFGAPIAALAGYMAATRRQTSGSRVTVGPVDTVNVQQQPGVPAPAPSHKG